jgi:hypothetical protein
MSAHRNRILVFLKTQNPSSDSPLHSCSRLLACLLLAEHLARSVSEEMKPKVLIAVHLTTPETWRQVKDRFRTLSTNRIIPRLKLPRPPENLDLSYPEPYRAGSLHRHEGFLRQVIEPRVAVNES